VFPLFFLFSLYIHSIYCFFYLFIFRSSYLSTAIVLPFLHLLSLLSSKFFLGFHFIFFFFSDFLHFSVFLPFLVSFFFDSFYLVIFIFFSYLLFYLFLLFRFYLLFYFPSSCFNKLLISSPKGVKHFSLCKFLCSFFYFLNIFSNQTNDT
jgi:hypothetical protein